MINLTSLKLRTSPLQKTVERIRKQNKNKTQHTLGKKFANHTSNKGLVPIIHIKNSQTSIMRKHLKISLKMGKVFE